MVLRFCTYPVAPWVSCSANTVIGYDSSVIRVAVSGLRLREGIDYILQCVDTMSHALSLLDRSCTTEERCDAVFGDIVPDMEQTYFKNITYSYPYQCTSLAAMSKSTSDTYMWGIFTPFSWQLWVLIACLPFIYGLIMTSLDFFIHRVFKDTKQRFCKPSTLPEFIFDHAAMLLGQGDRHEILRTHRRMYRDKFLCILRLSIQGMFLAFAFFCFVISSTYTAELTNILLKSTPRLEYSTFESIIFGANTLVPETRLEYFRTRWNIDPQPYSYENTTSYIDAMHLLQDGVVDGIVGNRATIEWLQNMDPDCTVSVVPSSDVAYYGPVIAWSQCVKSAVIDEMNIRIAELELDGTLEQLEKSSLRGLAVTGQTIERSCVSRTTKIGISSASGLFIIMASATGLPVCCILVKYLINIIGMSIKKYKDVFCGPFVPESKSVRSMDSYENQDSGSMSV
jgi:hypothetical protein